VIELDRCGSCVPPYTIPGALPARRMRRLRAAAFGLAGNAVNSMLRLLMSAAFRQGDAQGARPVVCGWRHPGERGKP
jgi:hypothetical protein